MSRSRPMALVVHRRSRSLALALSGFCAVLAATTVGCGKEAARCGGEVCSDGQQCLFDACRGPCPCAPDHTCVDGACFPSACGAQTCPTGEVCLDEVCGSPACGGASCGPLLCDPGSGTCASCSTDADCPNPTPRCNTTTGGCECRPESSTENCANGRDEDCDGRVDCAEAECTQQPCGPGGALCQNGLCQCPGGETLELTCGDGADNDCDGQVDCADPDCAARTCRAAVAACDASEVCSAGVCPPDQVQPFAHICRLGQPGSCDVAEQCDGQSPACPPDGVASPGIVCRSAEGVCDVPEVCDGVSAACPVNGVKNAGTSCGVSAQGPCDLQDACDGVSPSCVARLQPEGTVCRAQSDVCDTAETCDGTSIDCPMDGVLPSDALCRAAETGAPCGKAEYCTGTSKSCPANVHLSGVICRAAANDCDAVDSCDGSQATCPDAKQPAETACTYDNNPCTNDRCNGSGVCQPLTVTDNTSCPGGICCGAMCVVPNTNTNCGACGKYCTGLTECCNGTCVTRGQCGALWPPPSPSPFQ